MTLTIILIYTISAFIMIILARIADENGETNIMALVGLIPIVNTIVLIMLIYFGIKVIIEDRQKKKLKGKNNIYKILNTRTKVK